MGWPPPFERFEPFAAWPFEADGVYPYVVVGAGVREGGGISQKFNVDVRVMNRAGFAPKGTFGADFWCKRDSCTKREMGPP